MKKPRQFSIDAALDVSHPNAAALVRRAIHKAAKLQDPSILLTSPMPAPSRRTSYNMSDVDHAEITRIAKHLNISSNTAFNLIIRYHLKDGNV
jgi:hypothetical protein